MSLLKNVDTEATIKSINRLLDNSGFEGFSLREKAGLANTYEVIRPGGTVAEKLSAACHSVV